MNDEFASIWGEEKAPRSNNDLKNTYLCSCRLLQWMAERLPIDRRSCAMRGMNVEQWHNACAMLINARIINSQLMLLTDVPDALSTLRRQFDSASENRGPEASQVRRKHDGQADGRDSMACSCFSSMVTASETVA